MGGLLEGRGLYDLLVELTGLDRKIIESELSVLMHQLGIDVDQLRTEDLRRLAALYLDEIQRQLLEAGLKGAPEDWAEA